MPVNARTIWDSGTILGYCTNTTYDPKAGLDHELKMLNVMFSMRRHHQNDGTEYGFLHTDERPVGNLGSSKLADIILSGRRPAEGYWNC